jgi:uncharacterized protein involved in response to NO
VSAIKRTADRQRSWTGPAFLNRGFRPFFLAAGLWAVVAVAIWPAFFLGEIGIPTAFSPVDWHVHEMIYGYGTAVIAGFLLTAIPNWTGRLPVAGWPLALLASVWTGGRIAVFVSGLVGWLPAAVVDSAFLFLLAAFAAREVLAGKNARNVKVVALVLLLAIANVAFHGEATLTGAAPYATRASLAIIIMLILVIGGRVVPSFTHNWLARKGHPLPPATFGRADIVVMILSAFSLLFWIAFPDAVVTGAALVGAGLANLWRLSRWRGWSTRSDRLVLVLHAGFLFAALGFIAAGAHALLPGLVPSPAAPHIWAIGGIGTMTLAMMTRATLGHTKRALEASLATHFIYFSVIAAMCVRVAAEFAPAVMVPLIYVAAIAWAAAFGAFVIAYGPLLASRAYLD